MSNDKEIAKRFPPTWNGDPGTLEVFRDKVEDWQKTTRTAKDKQGDELLQYSLRNMETMRKRANTECVGARLRAGQWREAVEVVNVNHHKVGLLDQKKKEWRTQYEPAMLQLSLIHI